MSPRLRNVVSAWCAIGVVPLAWSNEPSTGAQSRPGIDQVLVTAQRRAERVQDVPLSVTAIGADVLQRAQIGEISDLGAIVPALVTTRPVNYGTAPLSLRGIGGANGGGNIFADEPVALYVNDAFVNKVWLTTADLVDVDSIQVLRGPQGTLYGRNSAAGAVLVGTAAPTSSFSGYVRSSFTTLGQSHAQAAFSGPLGKELTGRLAVGYANDDGWATNAVNGEDLGTMRQDTVRASLRWSPGDVTTADLIVGHQRSDSRPVTFAVSDLAQLASAAPPNLVAPGIRRADFSSVLDGDTFAYNVPTETHIDALSSTLNVRHDIGSMTLTSISAWQRSKMSGHQDSDGSALAVIENGGRQVDRDWSQELRLVSDSQGSWRWLAGAYLLGQESEVKAFTIANQFAFLGAGTAAQFDPRQRVSAWALFSDGTLKLNDVVSVTVGGRYSSERKRFRNHVVASTLRTVTAPPGVLGPGAVTVRAGTVVLGPAEVSFSESWRDFSPRAVLSMQLARDVLSYVSYSKGYKSGGFNAFGMTPAFEPERVNALEAGLKAAVPGGRAIVRTSVFRYDYTDLQVRVPVSTGGIDIRNAAEAQSTGMELELSAKVFDSLSFQAGVAWLDASFVRGVLPAVPQAFAFGPPTTIVNEDITGQRLSRAPKWQLGLSVEYSRRVAGLGRFFAGGRYRHQDEVWFLETNQSGETYRGQPWCELDLRVGLEASNERWEATLMGNNVLDDRHLAQVASFGGLPVASLNQPASWGVQFRVNLQAGLGHTASRLTPLRLMTKAP